MYPWILRCIILRRLWCYAASLVQSRIDSRGRLYWRTMAISGLHPLLATFASLKLTHRRPEQYFQSILQNETTSGKFGLVPICFLDLHCWDARSAKCKRINTTLASGGAGCPCNALVVADLPAQCIILIVRSKLQRRYMNVSYAVCNDQKNAACGLQVQWRRLFQQGMPYLHRGYSLFTYAL